MLLFIFLHLFHCILSQPSSSGSSEVEALLEFKKNANYSGGDWSTENAHNFCHWTGITCDSSNLQVTAINLGNLGLTGTISQSLIRLPCLQTLNLSSNSITGPLDPRLVQRLKILNLSGNNLSGPIPNTWSPRLEFLDLSHNNFSGTVPNICNQSGDSALQYVDLSANNLTGQLPESFGSCSKLQSLQVCYNSLHGRLPPSLNNCSLLRELKLDWNNLHGEIFEDLPELRGKLDTLEIAGNRFTGQLPSELTGMLIVNLAHNSFSGSIPESICAWKQLLVLTLGSNNITGEIPRCLHNLTNLQVLDLSNNRLTGTLPPRLENLEGFQQLRSSDAFLKINPAEVQDILGDNKHAFGVMKGGVPVNYSHLLRDLKVFDVSNNFLQGEIPPSLGTLLGIRLLNLSHNSFQGRIPPDIGRISGLLSLDMSSNNLRGEIPVALADLQLSSFSVAFNNLSGEIPTANVFNTRFGPESFEGNPELLGCPVACNSSQQVKLPASEEHQDEDLVKDFFGVAFAAAFFLSFTVSLCITLFRGNSKTEPPPDRSRIHPFQWLSSSSSSNSSEFTFSNTVWRTGARKPSACTSSS